MWVLGKAGGRHTQSHGLRSNRGSPCGLLNPRCHADTLKLIRVDAAKAVFRPGLPKRHGLHAGTPPRTSKTVDPAFRNHRHVIMALDRGNLGGLHRVGHDASGAAQRSTEAGEDKGNWNLCNRCDSHLQLTLARLGWSARSTRFFAIDDGTFVDLPGVAPKTVARWVDQATVSWTGSLELRMSRQRVSF